MKSKINYFPRSDKLIENHSISKSKFYLSTDYLCFKAEKSPFTLQSLFPISYSALIFFKVIQQVPNTALQYLSSKSSPDSLSLDFYTNIERQRLTFCLMLKPQFHDTGGFGNRILLYPLCQSLVLLSTGSLSYPTWNYATICTGFTKVH